MAVMRAWMRGIGQVVRAPLLVVLVTAVTFASAVPFGAVVQTGLQDAVAVQPPADLGSREIDLDWWHEFSAQAEGLAATFTPVVIGFAAPLDTLSGLLDGTTPPLILAAPIGVAAIAWAWIWGAALRRFHQPDTSVADAIRGGLALWPRFIVIALAAAALQWLLYATVHRALFGMVYGALTGGTTEATAFAIRAGLYVVFGVTIAFVSVMADYARVLHVVERPRGIGELFVETFRFLGRHPAAVAGLYLLTGLLFLAVTAGYGAVDFYGGARVGGWRGIALGQAYITGRLTVRLVFGASELHLVKALRC